jgi:hypothetical protein
MILRSMPFEAVEKWRTRRPRRAIESLELEEPIPGSIILFSRRERHHMFAACHENGAGLSLFVGVGVMYSVNHEMSFLPR